MCSTVQRYLYLVLHPYSSKYSVLSTSTYTSGCISFILRTGTSVQYILHDQRRTTTYVLPLRRIIIVKNNSFTGYSSDCLRLCLDLLRDVLTVLNACSSSPAIVLLSRIIPVHVVRSLPDISPFGVVSSSKKKILDRLQTR
jgi:hypothetical protein